MKRLMTASSPRLNCPRMVWARSPSEPKKARPVALLRVGMTQVDDPVVGGMITGAADVPGLLEAVDDQAGGAGVQAEVPPRLPSGQWVPFPSAHHHRRHHHPRHPGPRPGSPPRPAQLVA